MRIRMRATGQVEDFADAFARRAIEGGIASLEAAPDNIKKPGMPDSSAPETSAATPPETAMMHRPLFRRAPRSR